MAIQNDKYVNMKKMMPENTDSEDHRVRVAAERRRRMLERLSEAALRVMATFGPEGISVDRIIEEAGVSRGTFYKYYEAPADLIRAVGTELAQDLIMTVSPVLEGYEDPAARLSVGFRTVLQIAKENTLLAQFLVRAGWPATDHVPAFAERLGSNLARGFATMRFRTPVPLANAIVGGILIGVIDAMLESNASARLEEEATVSLLMALGIDERESVKLSGLPIKPPPFFSGGILARTAMKKSSDVVAG